MVQKTSDAQEESEIQLGDIFAQLLARKWIIVLTTLVGAVVGLVMGQLPPDQYRAQALVNIEQRDQNSALLDVLGTRALMGQEPNRIEAEAHIIRSRFVLEPVVRSLNLDWRLEPDRFPVIGFTAERRSWPAIPNWIATRYTRHGDIAALDLLEVDAPLINRPARLVVTGPGEFEAWLPDQQRVAGRVGEVVTLTPGFRFRISVLDAPAGRSYTVSRIPVSAAIGMVRNGLLIAERRPVRSGIVDFLFTHQDRHVARNVTNAVVDAYRDQNLGRRSAEIDRSFEFVETSLAEARQNTARATEALNTFRQARQTAELTLGSQELLQRIVSIESELEELAFREQQISQRLTPNHPDYRALLVQRERLEVRLEEMRREASSLPPLEQELLRLTQAVERTIEIERQLSARGEQLGIVRASTVSQVHMLEAAEAAFLIGPNRTRPILFGLLAGLILGVGGILALNMLRQGIDDSRVVEELGLPLFATINRVPGLRTGGHDTEQYALARSAPTDIVVEALRGLRTGLQFSLAAAQRQSLMITSPAPSMGKSFISYNLSIVAAQSGARVLLIDADMRKGKLRRQFKLAHDHPGLSELLSNRADIDAVLHNDVHVPGLDFISTGKYPPNPAELLTAKSFERLMQQAADAYDLVIIDTPPVLAVTDPAIIGQHVGMSLLVLKHLETTRSEILSSIKILETGGVRLSGAILNQFDAKASRYGTYGHKYGYYGGYKYGYD
jgi:tyrosine-protein kinase Etk/Wzc